ncbi:3-(cis-5,6-dihydroxycyclohexa-1,3-dien-1-yl)propanoate dehydrogenase [Mycobacterium sp. 050128]|uniref:3-(cis-5,6-dihydroxycyclohexa-1, 3-dien-1-yl)propanoate dehydrogenase n=1 Tax=Mycobacterium TaxID=1763 RepID=UPI0004534516|nr:3-(cis-5,6-dihydroxycyclohexa-1,3-dien-1-yl)propanoate dehydrogenase [Mycobacterium intracellulare]ARV80196.1 3-(cis-5,6-dihydroxycyclohexa-1,3-dien-1-yl)propanoate dehydrogenase [Mycobacterium intracellulare subsp. chimaera]ASL18838.1 2,3-dihydroxy-2,3-dihydrophenylpropionate dehydrogenase [Mycobacterium intracellulare subsp. chimaera]ETZ38637.1 cis-2,3-dihydrobiphenyl-2,3-diol dehydrogenase [Mycobacterium intracellulare MIN_052511_1280]KPN45897.1 2,3-dihydroxy-2,3-dihydrophenylpropionate d
MGWLDGRVALVTGGGSGIGLAVVERFLAEGAQVAVLDRSKDNIEELKYRHPGMVALVGDVTVFGDNQQAVATTVSAFGKLDVFVGNAGIFDYFAPLLSLSGEKLGEAFDELFAVNVKAYLFGARAAIPELLKANDPCMIFTVSTSGFYTSTGGTLYTASKHAVVGVVRELACELAPTIRVNGVAPGGTLTGLRGSERLGQFDTVLSAIPDIEAVMNTNPLQVAQRPADHAGIYVLLASVENSRAVTGVIINSDGGLGVQGKVQPPGQIDLTA